MPGFAAEVVTMLDPEITPVVPPPVASTACAPPAGGGPPLAPPDGPEPDERGDDDDDDADDERRRTADAATAAANVATAAGEHEDRLWIKAILALLQTRTHESDPSPRVQLAYDLMHVAACERIVRILNGDVDDDERP